MKKNKTIVLVDLKLYSLEAIYGASYVFLDKAYIFLEKGPKTKIRVILKTKEKPLKNLRDEFLNELLSFSLRDKISKNNKKIREYIIGKALSSALAEPIIPRRKPLERRDPFWRRNSSGVAVPWAEESREEKREDICEKELMKFSIPWDKKSPIVKPKKEKTKKGWKKDPFGIAIPWEEKYSKKEFRRRKDSR